MGRKTRKFNEVVRCPEFARDLKKLLKKHRTLEEDLATLVDVALFAFHKVGIEYPWIVRIDNLGPVRLPVYKVKRLACRALKGTGSNTGLRLIYAWDEANDRIHLIELYMKSEKHVEDRARIVTYVGGEG